MPLDYIGTEVSIGETASLLCNTSLSSDMIWTYDATGDNGYVNYVYWNRHIDSSKPRLSVNASVDYHHHSLTISRAQLSDSGLYDCYNGTGQRTVGYQLTVHGMFLTFFLNISPGSNVVYL